MKNPILRLLAISWRLRRHFVALCAIQLITTHFSLNTSAQAPRKFSFQAILRDAANQVLDNQLVAMRLSILQGSESGTAVYVETQTATTNSAGLVTLQVGGGTVVSGSISGIDWANGPYYIKTETDPEGGSNYSISGNSQLLSVPYALYSEKSGTVQSNSSGSNSNTLLYTSDGF
jgi:hypothetical protein